jgi:hypothetical protein
LNEVVGQRSTDLCAGAIRKLQQAMKLVDTEDDLKAEILLDLHFNTLLYQEIITPLMTSIEQFDCILGPEKHVQHLLLDNDE